ncbi:MAG: cobalamin biosynthesis protein [Chloroflexi bacterium]|nr:cobalamin biosynthesis protein [Chloroflexota bacterium]
METLLILVLAIALDLAFGEPPNAIHPVCWMGKVASILLKVKDGSSPFSKFLWGLVIVLITIGIFTTATYFAIFYLKDISSVAYVIVGAVLLKVSFSLRGLRQAALVIRRLLLEDKLAEARFELRALVKRDTSSLNKSQLVSATVESVAENSCDSFVAPLFYFLLFGVPGAMAYRVVNTLDAMIGYHGEYEYLGKFAARLDTVANFIPARISALAIVLAAWLRRKRASEAWRIMLRDNRKTASLNAGWSMSAIAGAMGVQLEKVGHYRLGDNHNALTVDTIDGSLQIMGTVGGIWGLVSVLVKVVEIVAT